MIAALIGCAVHAQPYPSKPVRVIVPYAAGGFSDISSRLITEAMSRGGAPEVLPRQIRVETDSLRKIAADAKLQFH